MGLVTEQEMVFDYNNRDKTFSNDDKVMLFRHSDLDGVGTEIVTKLFFNDVYSQQCEYNNVNEQILAFIEGGEYIHYDHIIVADISFSKEIAKIINSSENLKNKFILVDHHKTALWLNEYSFSMVEVERNGILASGTSSLFEILYNYEIPFVNKHTNIDAVNYFIEKVRRYDTWEWHKVYSDNKPKMLNELFFTVRAEAFIQNILNKLNSKIHRFMEGEWILLFSNEELYTLAVLENVKTKYIDSKIKGVKYGTFENKVYAYVIAENHISELGNQMCERLDIEFAVILDLSKNKVSLRSLSADKCDVSEIAKGLGGGGHACASGFQLSVGWNEFVEKALSSKSNVNKVGIKQKLRNLIDFLTK